MNSKKKNPFRIRIKKHLLLDTDQIVVNQRNWRNHGAKQKNTMQDLLDSIGFVDELKVVEREDGSYLLIDGEMRRGLAEGQKVPVAVLDLNEDEQAVVLATFDPVGQLAGGNRRVLEDLMKDMKPVGENIAAMLVQQTELIEKINSRNKPKASEPTLPPSELKPSATPPPPGTPIAFYCPAHYRNWLLNRLPVGPNYVVAEDVKQLFDVLHKKGQFTEIEKQLE